MFRTDIELISVSEAAKLLNTSTMTIYRFIKSGVFDVYKIGCRWKIPRDAIVRYIESNKKMW